MLFGCVAGLRFIRVPALVALAVLAVLIVLAVVAVGCAVSPSVASFSVLPSGESPCSTAFPAPSSFDSLLSFAMASAVCAVCATVSTARRCVPFTRSVISGIVGEGESESSVCADAMSSNGTVSSKMILGERSTMRCSSMIRFAMSLRFTTELSCMFHVHSARSCSPEIMKSAKDMPRFMPAACRAPCKRVAFDMRLADGERDQILHRVRTAFLRCRNTFELFDGILFFGLHRGGEPSDQSLVEVVLFGHLRRGETGTNQLLDLRNRQRVVGLGLLLPRRFQANLLGFEDGSFQFFVHRDEELLAARDEYQVTCVGDMVQTGAPRRIISHAHTTFR